MVNRLYMYITSNHILTIAQSINLRIFQYIGNLKHFLGFDPVNIGEFSYRVQLGFIQCIQINKLYMVSHVRSNIMVFQILEFPYVLRNKVLKCFF